MSDAGDEHHRLVQRRDSADAHAHAGDVSSGPRYSNALQVTTRAYTEGEVISDALARLRDYEGDYGGLPVPTKRLEMVKGYGKAAGGARERGASRWWDLRGQRSAVALRSRWRQRRAAALCSASVSLKAWRPCPLATK